MLSVIRLRLSMIAVMAAVIGLSTLVLTAVFLYLSPEGSLTYLIFGSLGIIITIHVIQWLIGPYIIERAYKVKPIRGGSLGWIQHMIQNISSASGLRTPPRAMYADVDIPNAFAYGNIFTGYKVAVTRGLIENLPKEEVEAVIAHEIGHIKHKDVEIMMIVSILPALIFWLGRLLFIFGRFGTGERRGEAALIPLIGLGLMVFSFVFNLFILYLSRLREYYADTHAATSLPFGNKRLQRALARILIASGALKKYRSKDMATLSKFKAFLISDPEEGIAAYGFRNIDEVVEWIKSRRKITPMEVFSTHQIQPKDLDFWINLDN